MVYKPVDRSFDEGYLKEQYEAMRWLATQGFSPEGIREFHWGNVVETEKIIRTQQLVARIRYNMETGNLLREELMHEFKIPIAGSGCEYFFLKSTIWCHWVFLKERPKTWRREGSKASLYSLSEIYQICGDLLLGTAEVPLTNALKFGTIEVSKLNITKTRSQGQEIEAEVIKT